MNLYIFIRKKLIQEREELLMFCPNCGSTNPDGAKFCAGCGADMTTGSAPVQEQVVYTQPVPTKQPGKGMAIAGMVCGIVSFLCFPYILGVLGIIFGAVAKNKGYRGAMATAGIACGAVGLALWLLMLVACGGAGMLQSLM